VAIQQFVAEAELVPVVRILYGIGYYNLIEFALLSLVFDMSLSPADCSVSLVVSHLRK